MCGIFGFVVRLSGEMKASHVRDSVDLLFKLSESRGKEAAGIALMNTSTIRVCKQPVTASRMIKSDSYKCLFKEPLIEDTIGNNTISIVGHSRLVTNGKQELLENNQPVIKDGLLCIHNGIVVNDEELWNEFPEMSRQYEVDTEVILGLISLFRKQGHTLRSSVGLTFQRLRGAASVAVLSDDLGQIVIATNNGSLYIGTSGSNDFIVFASEKYILSRFLAKTELERTTGTMSVLKVLPNSGYIIDVDTLLARRITLSLNGGEDIPDKRTSRRTINLLEHPHSQARQASKGIKGATIASGNQGSRILSAEERAIGLLRRCTRCVLPETFPFIRFDDAGVCNYCRNYSLIEPKGGAALEQVVDKYRNNLTDPDCIVSLSGGRDSTFTLHYVKKVLNLNPIAYTYDWGMVTDLARRNISRICGTLGVEHILISADITEKRENIRKNVLAWLKTPHLGTVPLFMAGDKHYFYYAYKLRKQNNIRLIVMGENHLEKTDFKTGFAGIRQARDASMAYSLSAIDKLRLLFFYGSQLLKNSSYLNSSLIDTFGAYLSYYMIPHDYVNLYDYVAWDENEIDSVLSREYEWERSDDTKTTWRIGDGTAAFYNYIYYTVAGFTENDTFRSNQIRNGLLSREKALTRVNEENRPRPESIQWYCDAIGIDFEETIKIINKIPKLYEHFA